MPGRHKTNEEKAEIVAFYQKRGAARAAKRFRVSVPSVYAWAKAMRENEIQGGALGDAREPDAPSMKVPATKTYEAFIAAFQALILDQRKLAVEEFVKEISSRTTRSE